MFIYRINYSYVPNWNWCIYEGYDDPDLPWTKPFPIQKGLTFTEAEKLQIELNQKRSDSLKIFTS